MDREEATSKLERILQRLHGDQLLLGSVKEVYVFGSYVRGALEVSDVDIDVELDSSPTLPEFESKEELDRYLERLSGQEEGVDVEHGFAHTFPAQTQEVALLYRRGMSLSESLERLKAVSAPPAVEGGFDFSLPALSGVEAEIPRQPRQLLCALAGAGALEVRRGEGRPLFDRDQPALAVLRALREEDRVYWQLETVTLELVGTEGYAQHLDRLLTEMDLIWYDLLWSED